MRLSRSSILQTDKKNKCSLGSTHAFKHFTRNLKKTYSVNYKVLLNFQYMNKIHQTFRKKIHKTLKIIHQIKENIAPNNYNYFPKLVSHQT